MSYYIDILEPSDDLNQALDILGQQIGQLYHTSWKRDKQHLYGNKPFNLNVSAFASMWFHKSMKVFVAKDKTTGKALGFLTGLVFRPMQYEASVFQIQEWYGEDPQMEDALVRYAVEAIRILGCDEIWVQKYKETRYQPDLGNGWHYADEHPICRYVRR